MNYKTIITASVALVTAFGIWNFSSTESSLSNKSEQQVLVLAHNEGIVACSIELEESFTKTEEEGKGGRNFFNCGLIY